MQKDFQQTISDKRVSIAKLSGAIYPENEGENEILRAICENVKNLGWLDESRGAFGKVIPEGARVLIKPNFVLHKNLGNDGLLPLITHPSVIKAVATEVLKANPAQVLIGDAPIQACDFAELLRVTGLDKWSENLQKNDARFKGIRDFRRTICVYKNGVRQAEENLQPLENYVLYNLGKESLLEPLTDGKNSFRVTSYDPRLMAKTHSPGNHQYLVAREVIEADVVINLPKLKTHKKAGITNALKNLVGINGNKEFLPHHRVGSLDEGGDCYPETDFVKRALENVFDQQNMTVSGTKRKILATVGTQLERIMRLKGDEIGIEGAWSGNETVPRMTLDLNRIVLYGKPDATLAEHVQRKVLHLIDAVIAGQGDGPLASEKFPLGMILAGENAAAIDWIGAHLLGFNAGKIALFKQAFKNFRWRIADFEAADIEILTSENEKSQWENLREIARKQNVKLPAGWRNSKA